MKSFTIGAAVGGRWVVVNRGLPSLCVAGIFFIGSVFGHGAYQYRSLVSESEIPKPVYNRIHTAQYRIRL